MSKLRIKKGVGLFSFLIMVGVFSLSQVFLTELAAEEAARTKELVYDFETMGNVTFDKRAAERMSISLTSDCVSGGKAIELKYNFTSPEKSGEAASFQIKNLTSAGYLHDFTNYTKLIFYVKAGPEAVENRDRIYVYFYSNVPGGKWVKYRAKVNENQEIDPELFCTTTEWKKITLDLKNGPFYKWNTAHPKYWKIFGTFKHDDFPWDKVFCIHVGVEKYDSGAHQGRVIFDHFQFLKKGDKLGDVKIPTSAEPLKPLALKTQKSVPKKTKPAVLFLSLPMQMHYGGAYLRKNMARLSRLGYPVAYYSYNDFYNRKSADFIQAFDVVVLLDQPGIDYQGTQKLRPTTVAMYEEIRKLLKAGGGLMVFTSPGEVYMKSFDALMSPYGLYTMTGCLVDENPTLTTYGMLWCAYTKEIKPHPLCKGVKGFWYPIGAKKGGNTNFDTLRNANTVPFDIDKNWIALASVRATTSFKSFSAQEGADNPWLQQKRFTTMKTDPVPLVAIREGVEGAGRAAVCGINMALTNFCAGNMVYDGICTGKGTDGKASDLDKLLMNILDWLGERSMNSGRRTITTSIKDSFAIPEFKWPEPLSVSDVRPLLPNPDQFEGIIGVRSRYSGGKSTVDEYAKVARELGIQYLVFLEDFSNLKREDFDKFKQECEKYSSNDLILIPGIRIQNDLGIWYFGFRKGLKLPQESYLKPGTRLILHYKPVPGQYRWAVDNGGRSGMACGNFRLSEKKPSGVPPEDYNVLNPFISLYTYKNGKLVDTMLDTYLKCAARTEWVSPITIHLIDSAKELRKEWKSNHFKTVYLRDKGQGLDGFKDKIGDRFAFLPTSYVTNGPKIEEWRSTGHDCGGGWWDWTRYRRFVKMTVSSEVGLKEIRVMDGQRLVRRFLPQGAKRFEHTLVLTYNNMSNNILIVTDNKGRQAISDEEWSKNQLLQLTWCADRNNMLSYAGLPAPKSASGSTAGNYPTPWNLEKGGFRENLVPAVNQDRSRLPHFDGQPMWVARVSPAPVVITEQKSEGDNRIARDIGRDICSPDVAIQTASCRLVYDKSVKRPHPWTRGPLVPMEMFNADLRYITFSHAGHLPAPVILEGRIKFLKDISFGSKRRMGIRVLTMTAWNQWGGYNTAAIQYSKTGNLVTHISYTNEPTSSSDGAFNKGAYIYFYPSMFGSVGLMSLDENLIYKYRNKYVHIGYDTRGKSYKAGDELHYRILVFVSGFDEVASTRLPEALRSQLGMNKKGAVSYTVNVEHGTVKSKEYMLTIDGDGVGFAGEILLPLHFPVSLPIVVENLNDRWTSVLYDREAKRMRPLGMHDNKAYCHRAPTERKGKIFIGHPFTLDESNLYLSVVQTNKKELTVQIHNPTDKKITTTVRRSLFFDMIQCDNFKVTVPAGQTIEYIVSPDDVKLVTI